MEYNRPTGRTQTLHDMPLTCVTCVCVVIEIRSTYHSSLLFTFLCFSLSVVFFIDTKPEPEAKTLLILFSCLRFFFFPALL